MVLTLGNFFFADFYNLTSFDFVGLSKFLVDAGLYESQEEAAKREMVLGRIKQVLATTLAQIFLTFLQVEVEYVISWFSHMVSNGLVKVT